MHLMATHRAVQEDLAPDFRLGYARPAAKLQASSLLYNAGGEAPGWMASLERAFAIQLSAADRLRVDAPQDQDLILLETDVMPDARFGIFPVGQGKEIHVWPWHADAWGAPSNAGEVVHPAIFPGNGRVAYYDLGRIWISDLNGLKMQSLRHVPLLDDGGDIYWDFAGTRLCWMGRLSGAAAVDLSAIDDSGRLR
jgi:hypothetical protein